MFFCTFPIFPVVLLSFTSVTTAHGWVPVLESCTFTSVSVSNVGSIVGTILITASVVTLVISVTTACVAPFCSLSGSFMSRFSDTILVVLSVSVTTDRSESSGHLDEFIVTNVLSLSSMGPDIGRSGKVSSGSALIVFFAFRQCLGQCSPSLVHF